MVVRETLKDILLEYFDINKKSFDYWLYSYSYVIIKRGINYSMNEIYEHVASLFHVKKSNIQKQMCKANNTNLSNKQLLNKLYVEYRKIFIGRTIEKLYMR